MNNGDLKVRFQNLVKNVDYCYGKTRDLSKKITELSEKADATLSSIATKKQELESEIITVRDFMNTSKDDAAGKKQYQARINSLQAQIKTLNVIDSKLKEIQAKLACKQQISVQNISRDIAPLNSRINEFLFVQLDRNVEQNEFGKFYYFSRDDGTYDFVINTYPQSDDNNPATVNINLQELQIAENPNFSDKDVQQKIIAHLVKEGYVFCAPKLIAEDEKSLFPINSVVDDLDEDIKRCEQVIHLGVLAAKDPSKQSQLITQSNVFVDVLSLADISNFNAKGEPYFHDEIIDENTQKSKIVKDPRTKYGLESEVITRRVLLNTGEIKRSSYIAFNNDGTKNDKKKIEIDTKIVNSKVKNECSAKITYITKGNLSSEEKQLGAFRFARELLRQYAKNDGKYPIKIKAGANQDPKDAAEQASMVYAALLMLSSAEKSGDAYIDLPSHMIQIDVRGLDGPSIRELPWKKKQKFIEKYFDNDDVRENMRTNFVKEFQALRTAHKDKNVPTHEDVYKGPINKP